MGIFAHLVQCLLLVASHARAREATVYITNSPTTTAIPPPSSLSASGARVLFADLLGLGDFHPLGDADGATLQALNAFGRANEGLFGQDVTSHQGTFILVDEFEDVQDILPATLMDSAVQFRLTGLPSFEQNERFVTDIHTQYQWLSRNKLATTSSGQAQLEAIYLSKEHGQTVDQVQRVIGAGLAGKKVGIVVVAEPETRHASRSISGWGPYRVPDATVRQGASNLYTEEFMGEFASDTRSPGGEGTFSLTPDHRQVRDSEENTTAPRGILPYCYSSQSDCETTTNKCSGHGSCHSQYKYSDDQGTKECFACTCEPTMEKTRDGGEQKTVWAGSACQKKDISSPFWLLTGTTVALLLVVSWGVGLMFKMGSEDLPSVIGAGVAGARSAR